MEIENTISQFRYKRKLEKDRLGTAKKTKERLGLASRQAEDSKNQALQLARSTKEGVRQSYSPEKAISEWMDEYESIREEEYNTSDAAYEEEPMRPRLRYTNRFEGSVTVPEDLMQDQEFTSEVKRVAEKYGIQEQEVYSVIQGESGFNPTAMNENSRATGLFQFIPSAAETLGTSVEEIRGMPPAEQVRLYEKYLDTYNYDGSNRLGIMQAAPAYADKDQDAVIYDVGSAAWEQNPGWRELNDGPITVRSINTYYARQNS